MKAMFQTHFSPDSTWVHSSEIWIQFRNIEIIFDQISAALSCSHIIKVSVCSPDRADGGQSVGQLWLWLFILDLKGRDCRRLKISPAASLITTSVYFSSTQECVKVMRLILQLIQHRIIDYWKLKKTTACGRWWQKQWWNNEMKMINQQWWNRLDYR